MSNNDEAARHKNTLVDLISEAVARADVLRALGRDLENAARLIREVSPPMSVA